MRCSLRIGRRTRLEFPVFALGAATLSALAALAAPPPESRDHLFTARVWPVLSARCLPCHGADAKQLLGDLDLRSLAGARKGGKSGKPAVVAGKPEESPLYLAITRKHAPRWAPMPPKENDRLTPEQVEAVRQWIALGAPWPEPGRTPVPPWDAADGVTVATSGGLSPEWTARRYKAENLWAYRPLARPPVPPAVRSPQPGTRLRVARAGAAAGANPIDRFLGQRLTALGLKPAPPADPRTLIRRVTYDLTGLPPTPEEVDQFVRDCESERPKLSPRTDKSGQNRTSVTSPTPHTPHPTPYTRLVDRLLASPAYGEHWGRHWLDVVRYADSSGFANDYERGNAWRYRDYVIRSFNQDKPYDQFVREQLAGDELAPEDPEMRVATGCLRMGPWELTGMEVAKVARQRFLDDVTQSVGEVFLGQALQCARCHDHKFDPVPTRDYYRIQAAFATTQLAERETPFLPAENTGGFEERRYLERRQEELQAILQRLDAKSLAAVPAWLTEHQVDPARWERALADGRRRPGAARPQGAFGEARAQLLRQGEPESEIPPQHLGFTPEDFGMERIARKGIERLRWELDRYEPYALSLYSGRTPTLRAVLAPLRMPPDRLTAGELETVHILPGGDPFSPAAEVEPGVLSAAASLGSHPGTIPASIEGRRLALAEWIASPKNPLTARVIVNRVWGWHFGRALAGNPNNFGATGKRPSHPDLLDYLAFVFTQPTVPNTHTPIHPDTHTAPLGLGWSLKRLHRLILTSEAYRRSAGYPNPAELARRDPEGTSYAAFRPRRLSAEELRDSMLAISGELNREVGGIPVRPEINREAALQPRQVMGTFAAAWEPSPRPEQRHRRSVYVLKLRGLRDPFMEVFNEPSPDLSCEARESSTVTPQVFSLFNSEASYARALALAARLRKETKTPDAALRRAHLLAFGREPDPPELRDGRAHWAAMTARHRSLRFEPARPPGRVAREAVEENTGERFRFTETLNAATDFVPDLQPSDVDAETRGLAEVCLALLNANELAYVY